MLKLAELPKAAREQDVRCKGLRLWAGGAVFTLAGAFLLPLLIAVEAPRLNTIATASILPFLILGVVCLIQAMKRATPEPYGCSPRQLTDTTKHT